MNHGNTIVYGTFTHINNTATYLAKGTTAQRPLANAGGIRFNSQTGVVEAASDPALTGTLTWNQITNNTLSTSGSGLSVSTSNGVSTVSLNGELPALSNVSGNGLVSRSGGVYTAVNFTGGTGITVNGTTISGNYSGGNGITVSGNTISLTSPVAVSLGGTGASNAVQARTNLSVGGIYKSSFSSTSNGIVAFTHNLSQFVQVTIYDNTNEACVPDKVIASNATTTTIDLSSYNVSGTWNVVIVG